MFRVGQKVEYIGGLTDAACHMIPQLGGDVPEKGITYTVDGVSADELFPDKPCVLMIAELRPAEVDEYVFGFDSEFFRPVQETGMQMLRALLTPRPIKEVA